MFIFFSNSRKIIKYFLNIAILIVFLLICFSLYNKFTEYKAVYSYNEKYLELYENYTNFSESQRKEIFDFLNFLETHNFKIFEYEYNFSKGSQALVVGSFPKNHKISSKYSFEIINSYDFQELLFVVIKFYERH